MTGHCFVQVQRGLQMTLHEKTWKLEWADDSHDITDQIIHWQRGRICYNSRHIKIIIPCLQTSWLYIFKFFSQDISLTYLPDYQWPLKCQDFLIWEGLLFTIHQISWIPRIHVGLWSDGREGTKSRVLGRIKVYNRRVVRWEHKDRDSSTKRKSMTHYLAQAGSG